MKRVFSSLIALTVLLQLSGQDFVDLVERVNKSVVTIYVVEEKSPGEGDPMVKTSNEGIGSGSIVGDQSDYVLTAAHVVANASMIIVELIDGRKIEAELIRSSQIADVALLKLKQAAKGVDPLLLGNSDELRLGEDIFIIGAPLGLSHSVSKGIISGKHRDEQMTGNFMQMEYLQTDASINKGNSGGPMFNMKGEIVGIVSSILTVSGGFEGVGFAASSNIANDILIQRGSVWFGIDFINLDLTLCRIFNVDQQGALMVQNVIKGSPGYFMGLKGGFLAVTIGESELLLGGDVILAFDDIVLDNFEKFEVLRNHLNSMETFQEYELKILRDGKVMTLKWKMDL